MTSRPDIINDLMLTALRCASDVARARLNRDLEVIEAEPSTARALLQFELSFGEGAILQWYVGQEDATGFSDLLIGGPGQRDAVLTDMHMDSLSGVFEEMIGAAVEGLSSGLSDPLKATGIDMRMEGELPALPIDSTETVVSFEIEGFGSLTIVERANNRLVDLIDSRLSDALIELAAGAAAQAAAPQQPEAAAAPQQVQSVPAAEAAQPEQSVQPDEQIVDNLVALPSLTERRSTPRGDLRMLLNVPLNITVELGRTETTVRDVLELGVGSILELQKLAGDPMDIMVNGQVLAKGEVVVIDEEFGIRITEICAAEERLRQSLG